METDEGLYHASPQTKGKLSHEPVDTKTSSNRKEDIFALPVFSEELGVMGKIDVYKKKQKKLIERKYQLKHIFQGQIYQLWAQFFCMVEMGYEVEEIAFYEISTKRIIPISVPSETEKKELKAFVDSFRNYDPSAPLQVNLNKCIHCIYCNLCDKTGEDNVYS